MSRKSVESEPADRAGNPHYVTLLGLCNDLLRGRWTIAVIIVCCTIGSALVRLAEPRTYTSRGSFVPDVVQPLQSGGEASSLGRFAGAALAGNSSRTGPLRLAGLPSPLPASSAPLEPLDPEFYWSLLNSHEFLRAVAGSQFTIRTPTGTRTGTAADLYGLPPGPEARRFDDAARRLAREVEVTSADNSAKVTLSVRTFDPSFARAVAERMLAALLEQNRRMSDARGVAQVAFLTRAALEARGELRVAQDEFTRFLTSNRAYGSASWHALEFRRLDADVVEKRQHYTDLTLQLERAKIDRSRTTQIISVVDDPETPAGPDPRGVLRASISGGMGGAALALLIVLIGAHLRRLRAVGFHDLAAFEADLREGWRFTPSRRRTVSPGVATIAPGKAR